MAYFLRHLLQIDYWLTFTISINSILVFFYRGSASIALHLRRFVFVCVCVCVCVCVRVCEGAT